jgi:hypothetical protein
MNGRNNVEPGDDALDIDGDGTESGLAASTSSQHGTETVIEEGELDGATDELQLTDVVYTSLDRKVAWGVVNGSANVNEHDLKLVQKQLRLAYS